MKFRVVNIVENVGKRVICVKLRRISVNHVFVWIGSRQSAVMPPQARRPGLIVHRPFYGEDAANFTLLVLGCIETKFCKKIVQNTRWKALAEIFTMHLNGIPR